MLCVWGEGAKRFLLYFNYLNSVSYSGLFCVVKIHPLKILHQCTSKFAILETLQGKSMCVCGGSTSSPVISAVGSANEGRPKG